MGRIIYLCNADDTPVGGIKVIYRHAELLAGLGADAYVLHPDQRDFRCTWFDHNVRLLPGAELYPESDFLIIPEIWAGVFGQHCMDQRMHFAIFVQNGYATHPLFTDQMSNVLDRVYEAADLVLSISDDTSRMLALNYPRVDPVRIVRVQYSVHERFLSGDSRTETAAIPIISYMTRKLPDHVWRVVFALGQQLREHRPRQSWEIEPIHNVNEVTAASRLSASRIFLSFSEFEGLPLPPLEAALAGNLVVGYTGQGAREYWHAPNFMAVEQGDIRGFVTAACEAVWKIDTKRVTHADLAPGIRRLAKQYSPAAETATLRMLLSRIESCIEAAPHGTSIAEAVQ